MSQSVAFVRLGTAPNFFRCDLKLNLLFKCFRQSRHFYVEHDNDTKSQVYRVKGFIWAAPVPNSPSGPSLSAVGDQYGGQPCLCLFFMDNKPCFCFFFIGTCGLFCYKKCTKHSGILTPLNKENSSLKNVFKEIFNLCYGVSW